MQNQPVMSCTKMNSMAETEGLSCPLLPIKKISHSWMSKIGIFQVAQKLESWLPDHQTSFAKSLHLHHVPRRQAVRKHCLQILEGDAVVLTLMLLPMLSRVTVTGAGNSSGTLSWNLTVLSRLNTHVQKTPRVQLLDPGEKPCYSCQHGLCSHESNTRTPAPVTRTHRQRLDPRHPSCSCEASSGRVAGSYPTRSRRGCNHSPAEGHRATRPAAGSGQQASASRWPVPGGPRLGKEMLVASFGKPYFFMEQCSVKVL